MVNSLWDLFTMVQRAVINYSWDLNRNLILDELQAFESEDKGDFDGKKILLDDETNINED